MVDVFIIGSKGIPAKYGGFETFVDKLTGLSENPEINYHVSCLSKDNSNEFYYNKVHCFNVKQRTSGSSKAIFYDIDAFNKVLQIKKERKINNEIVILILACRIGPFIKFLKNKVKGMDIKIFVNPDGHEWKRSKWNRLIKAYWYASEKLMIKHADKVICDSNAILNYVNTKYKKYNKDTYYISYGAEINNNYKEEDINKFKSWMDNNKILLQKYYLIVGRFVPENNYETIIREFLKSETSKDLVIVTNFQENKFYKDLYNNTRFYKDKRIKFVGTVYDEKLLQLIRQNAYAYIHGHEVGGTNPSLLEALANTKINILFDVIFNKEVAENSSFYFNKENNNLLNIINSVEKLTIEEINDKEIKAKNRINHFYSWIKIINNYESLFICKED